MMEKSTKEYAEKLASNIDFRTESAIEERQHENTYVQGYQKAIEETNIKELHEVSENVVVAWESLQGGQNYTVREVQEWLIKDMKPAIDALREALNKAK